MGNDDLTVNEASTIAGLSAVRVRALIASGELQGKKLGRHWTLRRKDVEAFAAKVRPGPGTVNNLKAGTLRDNTVKWPLPVDYGSMGLDPIELMSDSEYAAALAAEEEANAIANLADSTAPPD